MYLESTLKNKVSAKKPYCQYLMKDALAFLKEKRLVKM